MRSQRPGLAGFHQPSPFPLARRVRDCGRLHLNGSVLAVLHIREIREEGGSGRVPSQLFSGLRTGAAISNPANKPSQPKCPAACSGESETTGTFSPRPMASAISRAGTPSSATAWNRAPAGPSPERADRGEPRQDDKPRPSDCFPRRHMPKFPFRGQPDCVRHQPLLHRVMDLGKAHDRRSHSPLFHRGCRFRGARKRGGNGSGGSSSVAATTLEERGNRR